MLGGDGNPQTVAPSIADLSSLLRNQHIMGKVSRIAKRGLISLAVIITILALLIGGRLAYMAIHREDTFALRNSEFDDADYLRRIESSKSKSWLAQREDLPVSIHRLKRGSGTIFAHRFLSTEGGLDGGSYRKETLWIEGALPTSTIEVSLGDESKCLFVFSHGSPLWRMSGCFGHGTSGTVRVQPNGRYFTITIRGEVTPAGNAPNRCRAERVDLTFKAKEIAFEDLTPWLGIAGHHWLDEIHPQFLR
jgi:hypothetical protein